MKFKTSSTPKIPIHFQIIIGMVLGVLVGALAVIYSFPDIITTWIKPWGELFMRGLKVVAMPLVLFSLVSGIANVSDLGKLSKLGTRTISLYIFTTVIAITIGLLVVNSMEPWEGFDAASKDKIIQDYSQKTLDRTATVGEVQKSGPLSFVSNLLPKNIVEASSDNKNMLQVIAFALMFGIALVMAKKEHSEPVKIFFSGMNHIILKMVEMIMFIAPFGTFAILAGLIVDMAEGDPQRILDLLLVLSKYSFTVIVGLALMTFVIYPLILKVITKRSIRKFFKDIGPAQMLAFSTSSSAATLPLTMKCLTENAKVSKEVSGFVLPLGATINMDGTSCYQAIAAVFIANVMGFDLTLMDQLSIVVTATLASIGSAAVPGAGIVMLAIVLSHLNVPVEGIAIILGVDRILDMCRTVVNVTGDAAISIIMDRKNKA